MNTDRLARTTFVLDKTTSQDLAYISGRMGRSRSDLVREILAPTVAELAGLIRAIPDNPTPEDAEAFRRSGLTLMADAYMSGLQALDAKHGH